MVWPNIMPISEGDEGGGIESPLCSYSSPTPNPQPLLLLPPPCAGIAFIPPPLFGSYSGTPLSFRRGRRRRRTDAVPGPKEWAYIMSYNSSSATRR